MPHRSSLLTVALIVSLVWSWSTPAFAVRVKDVATIEGVRDNQLIGYGLVVGLMRTGDQVIGGQFTVQAMMSMLNKMGINLVINPIMLLSRNIASVMVTAKLPPFARPGQTLDVAVSSMANATSLQGGTLLLTPMKAPDQRVYAVAQGPISIGGFLGGATGNLTVKNHQAAGTIPSGAIIEKEVPVPLDQWTSLSILLRRADFTTALRIAEAIETAFGPGTAQAINAGVITVTVPEAFQGKIVPLIASIEALDVNVDSAAKVVVNERTGTVILGEAVRLSNVAISHGNLVITIQTTTEVSQPPAGTIAGQPAVTTNVTANVKEEQARLMQVDASVTLGDVVKALNALGVTPRDLVAILSAMKAAGALHGELEII